MALRTVGLCSPGCPPLSNIVMVLLVAGLHERGVWCIDALNMKKLYTSVFASLPFSLSKFSCAS